MFTAGRPRAFAIRSASGVFPVPGGRRSSHVSKDRAPIVPEVHDLRCGVVPPGRLELSPATDVVVDSGLPARPVADEQRDGVIHVYQRDRIAAPRLPQVLPGAHGDGSSASEVWQAPRPALLAAGDHVLPPPDTASIPSAPPSAGQAAVFSAGLAASPSTPCAPVRTLRGCRAAALRRRNSWCRPRRRPCRPGLTRSVAASTLCDDIRPMASPMAQGRDGPRTPRPSRIAAGEKPSERGPARQARAPPPRSTAFCVSVSGGCDRAASDPESAAGPSRSAPSVPSASHAVERGR